MNQAGRRAVTAGSYPPDAAVALVEMQVQANRTAHAAKPKEGESMTQNQFLTDLENALKRMRNERREQIRAIADKQRGGHRDELIAIQQTIEAMKSALKDEEELHE